MSQHATSDTNDNAAAALGWVTTVVLARDILGSPAKGLGRAGRDWCQAHGVRYERRGKLLWVRLEVMACGSPEPLALEAVYRAEDMHAEELAAHARFAGCRLHGEWFRPTAELRAVIDEIRGRASQTR